MNPDALAQLRDIHAAALVPWWPPAPGWWLVAIMLLSLLVWLGHHLVERIRVRKRRNQMLLWVDQLNALIDPDSHPQAYISAINRIFKLVALRAFPEQQCAAMAGQQWTDFLQQHISTPAADGALEALASGPYDPATRFDAGRIADLARAWIKRHG